MAKRTDRSITKVSGVPEANFLGKFAGEKDKSFEGMEEYRVLPFLKLIQGSTDSELKKRFNQGAAIIRPGDAVVCDECGKSFLFVAQSFYVEWCKWSDRRDTDSPNIVERTFDPTHDLAKKSKDADTRSEVYPGDENKSVKAQKFYRYVEHLNFVGVIYGDHPLSGTVVVVGFAKGEFYQGTHFINAIKLRRAVVDGERVKVPLWAQVWKMTVAERNRADNDWFGFDFAPPTMEADGCEPIIKEDELDVFSEAHKELKELHEAKKLRVDHNADGKGDGGGDGDGEEQF